MPVIWKSVEDELPPEGVAVRTMSANGLEQTLIRQGGLYWFQDMSMYVYYTVVAWHEL